MTIPFALDTEKQRQIQEWLARHDIAITDGSDADIERVAKKYHDSMVQDYNDAYAINNSTTLGDPGSANRKYV